MVKAKEKETKIQKEKKVKKDGFLKKVSKEMKEVKWASGSDLLKYTIATLVFIILLALFFEAVDIVSSYVKGLF